MKKIYLSALALGLVSLSASAQMTEAPYSFGQLNQEFKATTQAPSYATKALGVEVWANDFDNAADWTIDNDGQTGATFGWNIDDQTDAWGTSFQSWNSTSGGDFAGVNNGDPTATPGTQALDVTYTMTLAAPLDIPNLPANTNNSASVLLQYEEFGARFNDLQQVQVSTDGGTNWTVVRDNLGYDVLSASGGSAYDDPTAVSINITPAIAADPSNVLIRFSWTTNYPASATNPNVWVAYGWFIDDVKIVTQPDNDIVAGTSTWGSEGLNYYSIPTTQIAPIDFSAVAINESANTQTDVTLTVNVDGGSTFTGTSPAGLDILTNTQDTASLTASMYTPAATTGTHTIDWALSQNETDDNPGNNDLTGFSIEITDYIYARDNGTASGSSYNQGEAYEVGNFFDIWQDQECKGVDVMLHSGTEVGSSVYARIYSIDPTSGDFVWVNESDYHQVTASDLNGFITLELLSPQMLTNATLTYLVVVGTDGDGGTTDDVVVATAGTSEVQTSFFFDGTDVTWYYTTGTPMVRLNFDPTVSVSENNLEGVSVYPNPSNGLVNISNDSNIENEIVVYNMVGSVVATATSSTSTSLDLSANGTGVYIVKVSNANGSMTERVVIK